MIESRRRAVTYSGLSCGSGPLTLGQDNMIRCTLTGEPADINKQGAWPVPAGVTVEAAVDALRTLVERHESLRTVYPCAPGEQPTTQTVLAQGVFELDVVETDEDPAAVADRIGRAHRAVRFDVATEFPLRLALITVGGVPRLLSVTVCHAAADGAATGLLLEEWLAIAGGQPLPPPAGLTPLQLAERERSAAGARRARSSVRHWERILRTGPHATFADDTVGPSEGELFTLVVHSVEAARALERTARRVGASPSAVMLAAYAALASYRAAQRTVVVAALSSNRHRPGLADHIGTLAQDALIRLEVTAADFDQLIAEAGAASMTAYLHSTFESEAVWRLIDDTARARGARHARHLVLNDLSGIVPEVLTRDVPPPPEDPQLIPLPAEQAAARLMLTIWRLTGCVSFTLYADRRLFAPDEAERFATGLLALVREAATRAVPLDDIGALTGLVPAKRGEGWRCVDGSWIDPSVVRELLETALEKRPVWVGVDSADAALVAHVAEDGRPLDPESAHEAVMDVLFHRRRGAGAPLDGEPRPGGVPVSAALTGWEAAMAPQRYVIHREAPDHAQDGEAWARLPVVAVGDGRGAGPDPA